MFALSSPVVFGAVVDLYSVNRLTYETVRPSHTPHFLFRLTSAIFDVFATSVVGDVSAVVARTETSRPLVEIRMVTDVG